MKRAQLTRVPEAAAIAAPNIALRPGRRFRIEIEKALLTLQQAPSRDAHTMREIRDKLRGVLAHTAAIGETCQYSDAVNAVRAATSSLEASEAASACLALQEALRSLPGQPG